MRAPWAWVIVGVSACSIRSPCIGAGTSTSAERACADWATHYCNRLASCAPLTIQVGYGDLARCIERSKPVCSSALAAVGSGSSPSHVESCAESYDSASCDEVVVAKPPVSCQAPGSLPIGAACGDDSQCSGPNGYCRMGGDETCGTCAVLGPVGAGCYSDRDCDYGLVCYFTCMVPAALGAECDGMRRQCPATLVCLDYTCRPPAPAGAKCDPRADACDRDHGLLCDPETRSCTPYALADVGAPCGAGTICKAGSCATNPSTQMSTCAANAADGAMCDPVSGPSCVAPARCVDGKCLVPDATRCK